jgi:hypothetical protein
MTTASDIVTRIKADLEINGTDYDTQILDAIQSALRQLRGKRYWFLRDYTTITTTSSSETVALPSDFSALESVDLIANGSRLTSWTGFQLLDFPSLRQIFWTTDPLYTGTPQACAVLNNTLYLSCLASAIYSLPIVYYKQDITLPTASDSSIWFDDGYDVVRSLAQFIFKRDSQGFTATEEDGDMVAIATRNLDLTHEAKMVGA